MRFSEAAIPARCCKSRCLLPEMIVRKSPFSGSIITRRRVSQLPSVLLLQAQERPSPPFCQRYSGIEGGASLNISISFVRFNMLNHSATGPDSSMPSSGDGSIMISDLLQLSKCRKWCLPLRISSSGLARPRRIRDSSSIQGKPLSFIDHESPSISVRIAQFKSTP